MKKNLIISVLMALLFATGATLHAQNRQEEYLGLPGDNLNLYAVMRLFQQSKTLEEFERNLNDPKTNINNLDLNGDNNVDYIKVYDDPDGEVHNIVLQVAVGPKENQDVAVFTVQKFNNGQVYIQLTGDEELYGKNYIVEPIYDNDTIAETPNPGYTGKDQTVRNITYVKTTPVEIAAWPVVRFIYMPTYTVWRSSWYWGYYPSYWHPWRPFSWHYYYGYHYNWYNDYYRHYHLCNNHRYDRWNDFYYTNRRSVSQDVNHRIESGTYKSTYSHPEQRKNGEELFAKSHPDQYKKLQQNSAVNSERRTNQDARSIEQKGSNNVSTSRRSSTTVSGRSSVTNPAVKSDANTRRSSTTVTGKSPVTNPAVKSDANTRRSSTTVVNKSVRSEPSGQNAKTNRTVVQKKTETVSSSARRNTNDAAKTENKTKGSEIKDLDRRK